MQIGGDLSQRREEKDRYVWWYLLKGMKGATFKLKHKSVTRSLQQCLWQG